MISTLYQAVVTTHGLVADVNHAKRTMVRDGARFSWNARFWGVPPEEARRPAAAEGTTSLVRERGLVRSGSYRIQVVGRDTVAGAFVTHPVRDRLELRTVLRRKLTLQSL